MSTWYERGVFYHITNRFAELLQWILHIRSLGCNAIYIGPLFESTSHGYDTRDYKLVDRRLGDNESFKDFVKQCHDSGIRVVVDGVFNHTGREFFAFKDIQEKKWDSPYKGWYKGVNFDWQGPCGDPFGYDAWQGHFELPCLNLFNPAVRSYLFDVIRFWVDEFDIDGIRLDCANVLDFNFMKEMRQETARMKADFWLMGEVIHGDYSRWVNPQMLHSVTNYELHKSLYSGFNDHNFFEIAHNVRRLEAIGRQLYTFVDNHDEDRIASKLKLKEHLIPIYLCLFTLPGIPSIYYGGEWGVEGKRTSTSDEALRPAIPISQSDERNCELTQFIRAVGRIHDENEEFHGGRYQELLLTNRQYAFARHGADSVIITAVNNDGNDVEIDVPVPIPAKEAVDLLEDGPGRSILPVANGKVHIKLRGNRGAVLKVKGDNSYGSK